MQRKKVAVIHTGVANIASMLAALERLGADAWLTTDPADVRDTSHVVLPGVGAFGAGMARLRELGLVDALTQRFASGAPTLCVCLGLQLLCRSSEETPGVAGLGLIDADIARFDSSARVPQLGWNEVTPAGDAPGRFLTEPGYAYYANSYRLVSEPEGWSVARTEYAGPFVAALERGGWLVCQFHPELSSAWGQALMRRWLEYDHDITTQEV